MESAVRTNRTFRIELVLRPDQDSGHLEVGSFDKALSLVIASAVYDEAPVNAGWMVH